MIHRALLGSLERFFGVLIEHYGGAFPVWLAPVQVMVIPVAPAFNDYAQRIKENLKKETIRVHADLSDDRMNAKIRNAQNQKIPYMFIVGENEQTNETVSIRPRKGKQVQDQTFQDALSMLREKIASKAEL